jgi:starch synthase
VKIVHLSAECHPFAKTGGLADVLGALPKALAARGHQTEVWMPFHLSAAEWFRQRQSWPEPALSPFSVSILGTTYPVGLLRSTLPGSDVPVYFVAQDELFHRSHHLYAPNDQGVDDGLWRFAVFVRAAIQAMKHLPDKPHIIHVHDWHPALASMLVGWSGWRDHWFDDISSVLTLHNVNYQGVYDPSLFPALGLPHEAWSAAGVEHGGALNLLKGAILTADIITTVSPTYAWEIQTPAGGYGLEGVLRARSDRLIGILNGIDPAEWNPRTDALLPARYTRDDLSGKAACRRELCLQSGFDPEDPGLIVGTVGRLTWQKGYDVMLDAMPALLNQGARVIMVGAGEPNLEGRMHHFDQSAPGRFKAFFGYSEARAHLVEAGADAFLMPSRFEPCGLNQMYSLAYGTLPIVRQTGGLADTVDGYHGANLHEATGFAFKDLDASAISGTVGWAQYQFGTPTWDRLVQNAMAQDHTWHRSAGEYEQAYYRSRYVRGL